MKNYVQMKVLKLIFAALIMVLLVLATLFYSSFQEVENLDSLQKYQQTQNINFKWDGFEDQILRREKITHVCANLNTWANLPHPRHFLIDHHYKLMYCWIHKVASTSWIAVFSLLANRTQIYKYYREIKVLAVKNTEEWKSASSDKNYFKFLVVRHPFDRLVSAYRDRIEDNSRFTTQAWIFAPKILYQRKLHRSQIFEKNNGNKLIIIPTFEEFVNWLISSPPNQYDVHWSRYHDHCIPCKIQYDVVIKLETLNHTDLDYLIKVTGLQDVGIYPRHLQQSAHGATTPSVTCQYFKNLTSQQIMSLYSIYEVDFEMFGYSPDIYYNCSVHQEDLTVGLYK